MSGSLAFLETTGLTPAMVAIDVMLKSATVRVLQVELNDFCGVVVKITGAVADVQSALEAGRRAAGQMRGRPVCTVLTHASPAARPALESANEFNPLIQQNVVFAEAGPAMEPPQPPSSSQTQSEPMNQNNSSALGFIETQGFTAVFEAIDTACKAADVEVVGKEKLGGGYVTVIIQGDLSAVTAAVEAGQAKVEGLGKLIAAHVVARPAAAVLKLLPRI